MIIKRDEYINQLKNRMNNSLIKVITGLRRSGKSFLLFTLFKDYLLKNNVDENHIIEIKFDEESSKPLLNHKKLLNYIASKIIDKKNYYIFLDEIQNVKHFEPILIQLSRIENVDVYVTGSNSKFLSTDIDTQLNGKNDPIHVLPLSFNEFKQGYDDLNKAWIDYLNFGGLPFILSCNNKQDKVNYLSRTYKEVYLKDIIKRYRVVYLNEMEEIVKVLASSIGSFININNIINTFKSSKNIKIKWETASKYVSCLSKAFLLSPVERYDLKGRKYIGANKKYYFEDIGIRNAILDFKQNEIPHLFENLIFNELKYRGYNISIGMLPSRKDKKIVYSEVDFIASKFDKQYQIQACAFLHSSENILKREKASLINNYPGKKIIVTQENIPSYVDDDGIHIMNLNDFLDEISD